MRPGLVNRGIPGEKGTDTKDTKSEGDQAETQRRHVQRRFRGDFSAEDQGITKRRRQRCFIGYKIAKCFKIENFGFCLEGDIE